MRNVLITGGAGFVGRHFTRRLLELGDAVTVVDLIAPDTGGIDPADGWPLYDPRDYERFSFIRADCRDWFNQNAHAQYDLVLHLAAMVGGRLMIEHNPLAVAEDLAIDAQFWQWARAARPAKVICFSSSAAYPVALQTEKDHVLLAEDMISFDGDIGMPDMTYGWAKLTCEYLARLAHEKHGIRSVCYRPFSGYGEDQDDAYPFPSICKRAIEMRGQKQLTVWGSGRQMRDFIHISDCVTGVLTTMDKVDNGQAINLSTGILTSFMDFAATAADLLGYKPALSGLSDKPVGVHARGGDTAKQAALGFYATTTFREGIRRALEHYGA
ncbi:MAG: NAD-dependent epimerase/dehydratase family protein [Solirubrobacteraceae bacterium]